MKNCRRLFPVYGKYERQFLKRLKERITEYIVDFPNLSYDGLVEQFGSPKDIVLGYYDSVDDDYLLKKTNLIKNLHIFNSSNYYGNFFFVISFLYDLSSLS